MTMPLVAQRPVGPDARDIVDVLYEFDPFGGASLELVAWELCTTVPAVAPLWKTLQADGMLADAGLDPVTRERLVRLARPGRRQPARPPAPA